MTNKISIKVISQKLYKKESSVVQGNLNLLKIHKNGLITKK